ERAKREKHVVREIAVTRLRQQLLAMVLLFACCYCLLPAFELTRKMKHRFGQIIDQATDPFLASRSHEGKRLNEAGASDQDRKAMSGRTILLYLSGRDLPDLRPDQCCQSLFTRSHQRLRFSADARGRG